jgi:hypothetical protein
VGADAAAIVLTLDAARTLPRPGDVLSPPPAYNITINATNASALPIVCNGAVTGVNFVPTATNIIGLRFTAAAGCIIGEGGVLFRGLSAISSSMSALGVTDARLVFDNAVVRGPIRLTAATVTSSAISIRNTAVIISDCSVTTDLTSAAAVMGVGIASPGVITACTVEVTDSTVSCDGPSAYTASGPSSTVGVVGVATGSNANAVTVVFTNATVTSVSGFNWTQASSASLVGIAGIAAASHTGSSVTARRSTFRAANFVGANVGRIVAGVGTAGGSVTSASQITVTAVDGTNVSVSNVSFSSVGKAVGGFGIVLDYSSAPSVIPSISVGLDNAIVAVENFALGGAEVAVGGVGLALNYCTFRDANISAASTVVTVSNFSSSRSAHVYGVGAALYYSVIGGGLMIDVARASVIAIRDCPRSGTLVVGGVGTAQYYGTAAVVSIAISDSHVSLRDSWISSGVAGVGVYRYYGSSVAGERLVQLRVTRSTVYIRKGLVHTGMALVHGVGIAGDSNTLENTTSIFVVAVESSNVTINNTGPSDASRTTVGAVGIAGYNLYFTSAHIIAADSTLYVSDVGPSAAATYAAVGVCGVAMGALPAVVGGAQWNVTVRGSSLTYERNTPFTAATASSTKLIRGVGCIAASALVGRLVGVAISVSAANVTDVAGGTASAAPTAAGCPLVGTAISASSLNASAIVVSGGAVLHCVGTCVGLLLGGSPLFPVVVDVAESRLFQCNFALPLILWANYNSVAPPAASGSRVALTNTTAFVLAPLTFATAVLAPITPTVAGPDDSDAIRLCQSHTAAMTMSIAPTLSPTLTESASTTMLLPVPRSPTATHSSISNSAGGEGDFTSLTAASDGTVSESAAGSATRTVSRAAHPRQRTASGPVTPSRSRSLSRDGHMPCTVTGSSAAHPRSAKASGAPSQSVTWNTSRSRYSPSGGDNAPSGAASRSGHAPRATASQTVSTTHERSVTLLLRPVVAATATPTLLSPGAANAVSGAANGAAAVVSVVGAMPAAAAQAAMAQAAITMAECTNAVPETPLTFPQSLAPGLSVGKPRAGHYRGAMVASFASLGIGGALLLAAGYVLQRVRPQMAEGETGVFLRSLTAVMAPGTMFTVVAFNVDPVVGAATALLQVGEDHAVDAPVAVCGAALLALCVGYVWRAVRLATDPSDATWCLRFDAAARVVPPFRLPPFGLNCLTPAVLRWCFYGTGAWVDANFDSAARSAANAAWKPPSVSAAGRRLRVVIGSLRGDFMDQAVDQDKHAGLYAKAVFDPPQTSPSRRSVLDALLPATQEYVFFALSCTAATAVLRAARFHCALQSWLMAFVQSFNLAVLLAKKPYAVPAKNVLSIVSSTLTGAAFVCLAADASTSEGHATVKALGQSLAAVASLVSYPALAIALSRRLLLLYWLRRASQAADTADAVDVEDCLVDAALLGHRIFDETAPFNANSSPPAAAAMGFVLELVAPDSASEELVGTVSHPENFRVEEDETYAGADGMRFTRHAQDGDDQVEWTRWNPLRPAEPHSVVSHSDDFGGADDHAEVSRRRAALAAIAAVDDADNAVLLL